MNKFSRGSHSSYLQVTEIVGDLACLYKVGKESNHACNYCWIETLTMLRLIVYGSHTEEEWKQFAGLRPIILRATHKYLIYKN